MQNEKNINEYKREIVQQVQMIDDKRFLHYLYILLSEMLSSKSNSK